MDEKPGEKIEEKTPINIVERVQAIRSGHKRIESSLNIDPKDLNKDLEGLIKECNFHCVSNKILIGFEKIVEIETNEVAIFYFGENQMADEDIIAIMKAVSYEPARLWHLLATIKAGTVSKHILVALGSRYMNDFPLNPAVSFCDEDDNSKKSLKLVTETMWDKRYAFPAFKIEKVV